MAPKYLSLSVCIHPPRLIYRWEYVIKRQVNNQARLEYKFASSSIISMRKTWLILQRGEITSAMESLFFHLFLQDLSGFFILLETFYNISLKRWCYFDTVFNQLYCFRCSGEVSWGNISLLNRAKKAARCSATEPHHRPCTRACPPAATPPPWCIYAAVLAWPLPHGHSRPQPPLWPQPVQPSLH